MEERERRQRGEEVEERSLKSCTCVATVRGGDRQRERRQADHQRQSQQKIAEPGVSDHSGQS